MSEKDLKKLLRGMNPKMNLGEYVFTSIPDGESDEIEAIGLFKEEEGTTLVLKREVADKHHLPYDYIASWITLRVNSSLSAVGLTAAFAGALAKEGISCNVVAGFYHDHIFVEKNQGKKAIEILQELAKNT